jgi:hypothetical protein
MASSSSNRLDWETSLFELDDAIEAIADTFEPSIDTKLHRNKTTLVEAGAIYAEKMQFLIRKVDLHTSFSYYSVIHRTSINLPYKQRYNRRTLL